MVGIFKESLKNVLLTFYWGHTLIFKNNLLFKNKAHRVLLGRFSLQFFQKILVLPFCSLPPPLLEMRYGKTRVTSCELRVTSYKLKTQKHELKFKSVSSNPRFTSSKSRFTSSKSRVQIHEFRVQLYELWVQIHKLRVQIHELRVQFHEFKNYLIKENSSKQP